MRICVIAFAALVGTACAVGPAIDTSMQQFVGRPLATMTSRVGPPHSERKVAGEQWYSWVNDRMVSGFQGGPMHFQCRISVRVGPDTVVQTYHWEGTNAGCLEMARMFR